MGRFRKRFIFNIALALLLIGALASCMLHGVAAMNGRTPDAPHDGAAFGTGAGASSSPGGRPVKNEELLSCSAGSLLYVPTERREGVIALTPGCSEGVELEFDPAALSVSGVSQYGIFTFSESRELRMTARFEDGWTYNGDFSTFFESRPDRVTVSVQNDGEISFVFHAVCGESVALNELTGIRICATPDALPRLDIITDTPIDDIEKESWSDAYFTLTLGVKRFESGAFSGSGKLKGRGNTSWAQPKKSYSIKLTSKASLLDIPSTKKYALIASYSDASLMRNYITYKSGLLLDGISYTPKCEFLELYYNNEYMGVYLLVERIEAEPAKLDIPAANAASLTGGYIIEKTVSGKYDPDEDAAFKCPYRANFEKDCFVLKYPEVAGMDEEEAMTDYLENYFLRLHDAVTGGGEDYLDYVDMSSWVDFLIMQELTKNIDGNLKTSCYMYKLPKDDKLYMTALWDFDLAYGNADWNNAGEPYNLGSDCPIGRGAEGFMVINSSCPWYLSLYGEHAEFRHAVMEKYAEYREKLIPYMRGMISEQGAYLARAALANTEKWGGDFASGVRELRNWLDERVSWLDGQWLSECGSAGLSEALNAAGGRLEFKAVPGGEAVGMRSASDGGRLVVMSGNVDGDGSTSGIALTLKMKAGETLSFEYRVSSEYGFDHFIFSVDGEQLVLASGDVGWKGYTFTAEQTGLYAFQWLYSKDSTVSGGCDRLWLDEVQFSGVFPYPPNAAAARPKFSAKAFVL